MKTVDKRLVSYIIPNSLHEAVRELTKKEGTSINQFITIALAEKLSALMTRDYLAERARRGDRVKFERAMAKVTSVDPEEQDRFLREAA
ncbi:MAG: toxin-antitoxin system HicB family antitoxin [Anaerolineae bacterium]